MRGRSMSIKLEQSLLDLLCEKESITIMVRFFAQAILALAVIAIVIPALAEEAECNLESSMVERKASIGTAILNRLGLEAPLPPPESRNVSQKRIDDFRAVQMLGSMRRRDEPRCFNPEPFSKVNRPSFAAKAEVLYPFTRPYPDYDDDYRGGYVMKRDAKPQTSAIPPSTYRFTFPINLTYDGREFFSSELLLLRKVSPRGREILKSTETIQLLYLYEVRRYFKGFLKRETRSEFIELKVVEAAEGYISFNTTSAVLKWQEMNNVKSGFITFEVNLKTPTSIKSGLPLAPVIEFDTTLNKTALFVINFARPEDIPDASRSSRRRKRQSMSSISKLDTTFCFSNPLEPNCCVRSLSINFVQDLNYQFILFPNQYDSNYCTGLCPTFWPTASNSTGFLQSYRSRNPTFAVQPCCSPEDIGSLSVMLTSDDGETEIREMEDMIITSCICR